MKPITWSFGMQSRPQFHVGERPDLESAAQAAADAGMTEAIIFGKDHTGLCFHPTKYGVEHPHCCINLTKGMTDALHRRGLKSIAYANFGMDGEMGRRHHEWLQQRKPGTYSLLTEDHYCDLCPFTPYLEEYMIPMLREMFTEYGIDGVFLDTMGAFSYCCCPDCEAAFEHDFHRPLPQLDDVDDPGWKDYGPWQFARMERTLRRVRESLLEVNPEAQIVFNHVGGPLFPFALPGVMDGIVSGDPQAYFPLISHYANYLSSLPMTSDVFIERFSRGWGDRGALDDLTMEYKSAIIFMYRCRFCVGDRMHPEGRLSAGSAHAMKVISDVWRKMDAYLPDSLALDPDFIVLSPESSLGGRKKEMFTRMNRQENTWMDMGMYRLMLDCGRSFMVAPEFVFQRHLKPNRVLILPHVTTLTAEGDRAIREFLQAGGTVLAVENIPRLEEDESIPDWLGIRLTSDTPVQNAIYLPELGVLPPDTERTMVRGDIHAIETVGDAQVVLQGYGQENAELLRDSGYTYYNSSSNTLLDTPLLTCNPVGKGKAYFLNCQLFRDYTSSDSLDQRAWAAAFLRMIQTQGKYELRTDCGDVEIASYAGEDGATVHVLLNHGGRQGALDHGFVSEHICWPQPAFPVELRIRSQAPLCVTVNGKPVSSSWNDNVTSVCLTMDELWKVVRAEPC